jgi:hypothetical protein
LVTVILGNGLEEIGERAFSGCALECIEIPPAIIAIKAYTFFDCSDLTILILGDGLEESGERAFSGCALKRIEIPPTVTAIHEDEFLRLPKNDKCEVMQ